MIILMTTGLVSQYRPCFVEVSGGMGSGVGAGVGAATGLLLGGLLHGYLVKFKESFRWSPWMAGSVFYAIPAALGAVLGVGFGAALSGSPFFAVIIPSLFCHPTFVAKNGMFADD